MLSEWRRLLQRSITDGRSLEMPAHIRHIALMISDSTKPHSRTAYQFWALGIIILMGTAGLLFYSGRPPICTCGTIKLWQGEVLSSEMSQQLSDWYSFSHIIHGFIFYGLICWLLPRWPFAARLLLALTIEGGWELLENSNFIIERYRQTTASLNYSGDSILNSLSDMTCMTIGFFIASRLRWWQTLALAVVMELSVGYLIHDNLTLNILMLVHPVEAIKHWQQGLTLPVT